MSLLTKLFGQDIYLCKEVKWLLENVDVDWKKYKKDLRVLYDDAYCTKQEIREECTKSSQKRHTWLLAGNHEMFYTKLLDYDCVTLKCESCGKKIIDISIVGVKYAQIGLANADKIWEFINAPYKRERGTRP